MRSSVLLSSAFAALLVILGASSFAIWRNARSAQGRVAALHIAHFQDNAALSAIRASVYQTGILTRDYLLDTDPAHAAQYTDQFEKLQAATEANFTLLGSSTQDEGQQAALRQLRDELRGYWDRTGLVLEWSPEQRREQRSQMLQQRVRKRQEIFTLAAQVEQLITANFNRERERITTADQEFRWSLGSIAAIALLLGIGIAGITLARMLTLERQSQAAETQLRLLSGELRTAQESERKYLSRELHDQVGQMLTGLRMELAGMARLQDDEAGELTARIGRAKATVEQTLRMVRNIAMLLRPSMLDDLGLTPALIWLTKEVSRSSGMDIQADLDPAIDGLPDAHRTCLFRIVQEALTNAAQHAGARTVEVSLKGSGEWVDGAIVDDGRGFDNAGAKGRGLGLLGMEERVRELGGSIRIISTLGRGTRVEIRLPRPAEAEVADDTHPDSGRSRDRSDRIETSA